MGKTVLSPFFHSRCNAEWSLNGDVEDQLYSYRTTSPFFLYHKESHILQLSITTSLQALPPSILEKKVGEEGGWPEDPTMCSTGSPGAPFLQEPSGLVASDPPHLPGDWIVITEKELLAKTERKEATWPGPGGRLSQGTELYLWICITTNHQGARL